MDVINDLIRHILLSIWLRSFFLIMRAGFRIWRNFDIRAIARRYGTLLIIDRVTICTFYHQNLYKNRKWDKIIIKIKLNQLPVK